MGCNQKSCQTTMGAVKLGTNPIKEYRQAYPIVAGILIALIPKCPFCIAAYSSAIALCSGAKIYNQSPDWTNYISIGLAALTLLMILFNYKGKRTIAAAILVVLGSCLIIRTELYTGDLNEYYLGVVALLAGVWANASFMFFYNRWIRPLLIPFAMID